MLTQKQINATLDAQENTLSEIIGKIRDARDSYEDAKNALDEALTAAGELNIPGAELLRFALELPLDESNLDEAETVAGNLEYLFDDGAIAKLYPRCLGCINYRAGNDCVAIRSSEEFDYPCSHYAPMPEGCHCLRCKSYGTRSCKGDPGPCPEAHCCGMYQPAEAPAEDPAQGQLDI